VRALLLTLASLFLTTEMLLIACMAALGRGDPSGDCSLLCFDCISCVCLAGDASRLSRLHWWERSPLALQSWSVSDYLCVNWSKNSRWQLQRLGLCRQFVVCPSKLLFVALDLWPADLCK
jgi:hypothetical protein